MQDRTVEMALLYDFYADVLTERQREFFDLYYNEDYSLFEISESAGITRQGVRDVIMRAERIMRKMEERLGLVARFSKIDASMARILESAQRIKELNGRLYLNDLLDKDADTIITLARQMME